MPAPFSRRGLMTAAAALPLAGLALRTADASAPKLTTQIPAWYRFNVGAFQATVVSDGPLPLGEPSAGFPTAPKAELERLLTGNFLPLAGITLEQNALVLNTGRQLVLFDTGMGSSELFGKTTGKLLANLRLAGFLPEQFDAVVMTHAHCDHCWAIMGDDGKPNFPNARYYLTEADLNFWTDESKLSRTDWVKVFVEGARKNLLPVRDRLTMVRPGQEVLPGVQAIATPGHTVGHVSYLITSDGKSMLNIGDLAHHEVLLLQKPTYEFAFDTDPKQAAQSRLRVLPEMARQRIPLLGYHFPFPGIGNIAPAGDGFQWYPTPMQLQM